MAHNDPPRPATPGHRRRAPRLVSGLGLGLLAALSLGCELETRGTTNPITPTTLETVSVTPVLVGTWRATAANTSIALDSLPAASACRDVEWAITAQQGKTYHGTFTVRCDGGIVLSGNATGVLSETRLDLTADGTVSTPDLPACPFNLTGSATLLDNGDIPINYSGTTCLGPIQGSEVLHR